VTTPINTFAWYVFKTTKPVYYFKFTQKGRLKPGTEVIERECAAAYNLTSEEVKNLLDNFPTTMAEKCFLKCFGEGTETVNNIHTHVVFTYS